MAKKKGTSKDKPRQRTCGAMPRHFYLLETNPAYRAALVDLESATARRLRSAVAIAPKLVTIPVVVHVLHNNPAENVSAAQIRSQIKVLNRDFRAKNPDKSKTPAVWKGLVTDTKVQFKLAKKDPSGKPTNGINRVATTKSSFDVDDSMKFSASGGADAWPTNKYLNIWVCTISGGVLGYAQFPGGPASTDGVVILNTAFGTVGSAAAPFNLGRTTTHEVGHWLNLRHIWADTEDCSGTDFVADTPNALLPNFGTPSFPHVSCNNGPNGDMFMNYMDYTDDVAMFMFTAQQVERMRAALEGPRSSFL